MTEVLVSHLFKNFAKIFPGTCDTLHIINFLVPIKFKLGCLNFIGKAYLILFHCIIGHYSNAVNLEKS